jgi:hypothetical protein
MTSNNDNDYTTPSAVRAVTSYPARRLFKPGVIDPSTGVVPGVEGAIDVHCHASDGQQDPFGVAKVASRSGMRGLLYKSIVGRSNPAQAARNLQQELDAWCEKERVTPITCWAGASVTEGYTVPIRLEHCKARVDSGCVALWMPVVNSANSLSAVGGRSIQWDKNADNKHHTDPLPWETAVKCGHYLLDDNGKLKSNIQDIFRLASDRGVALFFGHPTKRELWAMAEMCQKLNFKRGVIDHPFSPFVSLTIEEMKQCGAMGLWINFTFDEISPLLGVDPRRMYDAVRAVGPAHCTLSSDCGEPLFPNSVEGMRLMNYYMTAFGCSAEEIDVMMRVNPAFIVGLDLAGEKRVKRAAAE